MPTEPTNQEDHKILSAVIASSEKLLASVARIEAQQRVILSHLAELEVKVENLSISEAARDEHFTNPALQDIFRKLQITKKLVTEDSKRLRWIDRFLGIVKWILHV